jgi:prefoldin subunit 5
MSSKTPVRVVFDGSNNATGLAEFQSGEFIPLSAGGIGASLSIGTAGQVLKVNSGASALEFGNVEAILNIDGLTDGSGITIADSDDFAISDAGTEKKVNASQISTYVQGTISGDITISGGTAAIGSGVIVNADINSSAAIADSKLDTISTAGKVSLSALEIDGGTDIGAALTTSDLIVVDDGAGGTNRKAAMSRVATYIEGGISGDITISSGTAAIGSGVIVNADVNASAALEFSKMENLTASRALVSDSNGDVSAATTTSTEIGYVNGVTSAIQTQLDAKASKGFATAMAIAL